MKQSLLLVAFAFALLSCNSNGNTDHSTHDSSKNNKTSIVEESENIQQVKPTFANLDANVSAHIKGIFDHYIHVKTALVNSNAAEAKNGANAILDVLRKFDKSLLLSEQKGAYDKSISNFKAAATGIVSTSDIKKQREHFASLSNTAYELAKSFGAGKTVYHEHCPMAFDNKGAMWLSESKEIKNPYYGDEMLECGTVEEVIEK